jgi:NAD(P)-dependent dehydrogenase (short-subunit alcohol dehydrogenase family)
MSARDLFDLSGRVAVVTGASSGLGRSFARSLAEAGATVVAAARRTDRLQDLARDVPGIITIGCDVTDAGDRDRLIAAASETNGAVDVLVNNAGRPGTSDALSESAEQFDALLDVNLASIFHLSVALVRGLPDGRPASIINIASILGLVSAAPNGGAGYAASKAGLIGMTRELAGQWGQRGVRVNAVVPGWFDTEITERMFTDERSMNWVARNTMLRRAGREGEVDGAVIFLAADASSYVTGQVVVVDGGWTAR